MSGTFQRSDQTDTEKLLQRWFLQAGLLGSRRSEEFCQNLQLIRNAAELRGPQRSSSRSSWLQSLSWFTAASRSFSSRTGAEPERSGPHLWQ